VVIIIFFTHNYDMQRIAQNKRFSLMSSIGGEK
jgi:hypothetical protein